jgi:hypothetical protein
MEISKCDAYESRFLLRLFIISSELDSIVALFDLLDLISINLNIVSLNHLFLLGCPGCLAEGVDSVQQKLLLFTFLSR